MAFRETFEEIAGCRTRVLRAGKGEPLVFLHGARGASQWSPFMEQLSQRYELFVPEHPGFGGSDTPEWLDVIGDLAYFYLDFFKHFGLTNVNLVGASIGGWIACELAVRSTHDLKSLTLVAPAGLRVKGLRKADIFMMSPEETVRNLFHDAKLIEGALAHVPSDSDIDADLKNRLMVAKLAWEPRLYNPHLHKWMHRIDVPTLVLWGEDDKMVPAGYGNAFRDLIPNSRFETIGECGHLPHYEKADAFVSKVSAFVSEVRP